MITQAHVLVEGEVWAEVTSQYLLTAGDVVDPDTGPYDSGGHLSDIRMAIEDCFRTIFPGREIEVIFPEIE